MNKYPEIPAVLTIAGSDSGGGAGIQTDLKTFSSLNVFGTSAITCITAQNPDKVNGIEQISPDMICLQIKTVCNYFHIAAAKTGMLYSSEIILAVSKTIAECKITKLVVDPVMIATSGARLLEKEAVGILCSELLPKAMVMTPNVPEAEILCGHNINSIDEIKTAAHEIGETFKTACVIKGGHLQAEIRGQESGDRSQESGDRGQKFDTENKVIDVLYNNGKITVFSLPRVDAVTTHGTGCVFSAALTAFLARGEQLTSAVKQAKEFVAETLKNISRGSK